MLVEVIANQHLARWIALGHDTSASARDRISALNALLSNESPGRAAVTVHVYTDAQGNVVDVVEDSPDAPEGDQV